MKRPVRVIVAMIAIGAMLFFIFGSEERPIRELPVVDLDNAYPEVTEAIEAAMRSVEESPRSANEWGQLGRVLLAHEFDQQAIECFEEAAALDPEESRWCYLEGVARETVDREDAISNYEEALSRDPARRDAMYRLVTLQMDLGKLDDARSILFSPATEDEKDARLLYLQARWQMLDENDRQCRRLVEEALAIAPYQFETLQLGVQVNERLGKSEIAASLAERLKSSDVVKGWNDPELTRLANLRRDPAWIAVQAEQLRYDGELDQAVKLLEPVVAKYPGNAELAELLAVTLVELSRASDAESVIADAVAAQPENARLLTVQGLVLQEAGHWEESGAPLEEALRTEPDSAVALFYLGRCRLSQSNVPEAVRLWKRALELDPTLEEAREALRVLTVKVPESISQEGAQTEKSEPSDRSLPQ